MSARILFHVQHLLGIGHLRRAATLVRHLAAAGHDVILTSGGLPVPGLDLGGARLVQLPPVRATDKRFKILVDSHDVVIDDAFKSRRVALLLDTLRQHRPDLLITELENQKLGMTDDPRDVPPSASGRTIPRAVRRQVVERDGWQCGYVSPDGRRCESRWQLEFDHIEPFATGGESTADNVRILCRPHNQLMAERAYGASFMERKRRATEAARGMEQPLARSAPAP